MLNDVRGAEAPLFHGTAGTGELFCSLGTRALSKLLQKDSFSRSQQRRSELRLYEDAGLRFQICRQ